LLTPWPWRARDVFADAWPRQDAPGAPLALLTLGGVRRNQGRTFEVIDQLNINMIQRAIHIQPRTLGGAENLLTDAFVNVPTVLFLDV